MAFGGVYTHAGDVSMERESATSRFFIWCSPRAQTPCFLFLRFSVFVLCFCTCAHVVARGRHDVVVAAGFISYGLWAQKVRSVLRAARVGFLQTLQKLVFQVTFDIIREPIHNINHLSDRGYG